MTAFQQRHAGQRRYHDFPKLREWHLERLRQSGNQQQHHQQRQYQQNQQQQRAYSALARGSINEKCVTASPFLPASLRNGAAPFSFGPVVGPSRSGVAATAAAGDWGPLVQTRRTFLSGTIRSFMHDVRLKQLERISNSNPSDPSAQYDFLSELAQRYPEAVVERFEMFPDLAVDERCALLYFGALQRINGQGRFDLRSFVARMKAGGGTVHPIKLQALSDLASGKALPTDESGGTTRKLTKAQQAAAAMQIIAGAGPAAAVGIAGGAGANTAFGGAGAATATGLGGLGSLGLGLGGGGAWARGSDPRYPLHVQMHPSTGGGRNALFTLARHVLVAFVVVSALTAVLDEKGVGRAMGMSGGKHIQEAEGSEVRFDDVKGVTEAKAELEEIVMYLKDPQKFTRLGGKLPRGLLLTGPPGTGKTLLAKAIAGEAGVPFFFSSGSQFEEVYVGLGAKRVRELFEAAKKKAPAIIFIDEIDAVGGTRRLKDQSALKMTLNELLVQLDGFEENNGIIVIGATNFVESLDAALLRPGRFDKNVAVPLPDVGGRKEILEMYAKKTKLAEDVDLNVLARGTTGFSGADLYNLMNQAALKASVDGLSAITMSVLEYAKDKILMGAERKSAVITEKTARCTAYHEAGHALIGTLTEGAMPIHKATIMPRGNSLGMVTQLPEGDQTNQSKKEMLARMDVAMGGRVAEELVFGPDEVTSGASSDIKSATRMARAMVTKFGFSDEVGIVFHGGDTGEKSSSATHAKIDEEVRKLMDASYKRATELLKKHAKEHRLLAETLLEYETLTGDEVRDIVIRGKKPDRPIINTRGGAKNADDVDFSGKRSSRFPVLGGKVGSRRDSQ